MLIVCPNCATSYDVALASLQPSGRQVRCIRCRTVWHAQLSQADRLVAAAAALAPAGPAPEIARPQQRKEIPAAVPSDTEWADQPDDGAPAYTAPSPESLADLDTLQSSADSTAFPDGSAFPDDDMVESVAADAPSIAPVDLDEGRQVEIDADQDAAQPQDIESIAARRYRRDVGTAEWRWPLSRLQTAIMALVLVDAIIVGWRADFVRAMPQTASFFSWMGMSVNLRGLDFQNIATATEQHDGVPILVVEGNIVNDAHKIVDVPRIKFVVRNAAKQEVYAWTAVPSRQMLPPGEAVAFHSRLASPPPDGHDVLVRFVNRRDIVAGDR
jgi:predicted Zn finger-like uncharacterized protein